MQTLPLLGHDHILCPRTLLIPSTSLPFLFAPSLAQKLLPKPWQWLPSYSTRYSGQAQSRQSQPWKTQQQVTEPPHPRQSNATASSAIRRRSRCQSTAATRRRRPHCQHGLRPLDHRRRRAHPPSSAAAAQVGSMCQINQATTMGLLPAVMCPTTTPLPRLVHCLLLLLLLGTMWWLLPSS